MSSSGWGMNFVSEALIMEQRGIASSGTNSLYIFTGKSVEVVDRFSLNVLILVKTSAS